MKKEELLKSCRYYTGDDSTSIKEGNFWIWEKRWVEADYICQKERETTGFIADACRCYVDAGLLRFENTDGVPLTLKAVLYLSFLKGEGYDVEEFKRLYYRWRSASI